MRALDVCYSLLSFDMRIPSPVTTIVLQPSFIVSSPIPTIKTPESATPEELLNPPTLSVQGLIYCKSGSELIPIKGALARITCLGVDKYGYESAPFSTLSHPTDANGYFLAILSPSELKEALKIRECKAFLQSSPLETCKLPTNVHDGKNGALLTSFRLLSEKNIKLYSVGPFVYDANSKSISEVY